MPVLPSQRSHTVKAFCLNTSANGCSFILTPSQSGVHSVSQHLYNTSPQMGVQTMFRRLNPIQFQCSGQGLRQYTKFNSVWGFSEMMRRFFKGASMQTQLTKMQRSPPRSSVAPWGSSRPSKLTRVRAQPQGCIPAVLTVNEHTI